MSRKWWVVVGGSFFVCAGLVIYGFRRFESESFLENVIVEAVGLTFAFGLVVWLIEGPLLSRDQRLRNILEYKWKVFQRVWEICHLIAREIAQPIAGDFEDKIDLYGDERGSWTEFEPLLRAVFAQARHVPENGIPPYVSLDEESININFESCRLMVKSVNEVINSNPDLENQVFGLSLILSHIENDIERAIRLNLCRRSAIMGHF